MTNTTEPELATAKAAPALIEQLKSAMGWESDEAMVAGINQLMRPAVSITVMLDGRYNRWSFACSEASIPLAEVAIMLQDAARSATRVAARAEARAEAQRAMAESRQEAAAPAPAQDQTQA